MNINEFLILMRITRARAARELECSRSTMTLWCDGKRRPGRDWWPRIQAWSRGAITEDVPKQQKKPMQKLKESAP